MENKPKKTAILNKQKNNFSLNVNSYSFSFKKKSEFPFDKKFTHEKIENIIKVKGG